MNVKLLRKVAKHILAEPKRFDMSNFGYGMSPEEGGPACGTVCCIAGWASVLSLKKPLDAPWMVNKVVGELQGCKALRLSPGQGERLFFVSDWPQEFKEKNWQAITLQQKAEIAAARIEHFIKTKGKE